MARQCPNGCGRSFREHGNGLAFHLTWCVPVEPSSADPIDRAIASIAEPTRPDPIPAMRPVLVRTVRRGPADADADMVAGPGFILPRALVPGALDVCNACDMRPMVSDGSDNGAGYCSECLAAAREPIAEPVRDEPWHVHTWQYQHLRDITTCRVCGKTAPTAEPVAEPPTPARKARTSRKAPSANVVRDGRDVIVGPIRVSFLDFADLPAEEHHRVREMLKNGGKGLAPARSRAERVLRVADPLATSAAPIVGWRAPVSPMPTLAYVAERGAGDHRAVCSSWPRLSDRAPSTAARERFAHAPRVGFRMTADPLATVARPPVLGPSTGRPVSHALAMGLRERAALAVAEPVAAAPAAVAVEMSPSLRASLTFAAGISRQGAARGRRARAA